MEYWNSRVVDSNQPNYCCIAYWAFIVVFTLVECIQSACCITYWVFIVMYNSDEQWSSGVAELLFLNTYFWLVRLTEGEVVTYTFI